MPLNPQEIASLEATARAAIKQAFGTPAGKSGVNLFVSHHFEEIEAGYWQAHLGSSQPEPEKVLDILVLRSHWGEDDTPTFDFTLPDHATDYVVSVRFGTNGQVVDISMES